MVTECVKFDNSFSGNCLETDGEKIYSYNCSNFSSGCPEEDFFDYEFYICEKFYVCVCFTTN